MKVIVCRDYEEMSDKAAEIVMALMNKIDCPKLGLATGSTPLGLYKRLVEAYKQGKISFRQVETVNLDEYVGIDKKNVNSYYTYMHDNLFNQVDIDRDKVHIPTSSKEFLNQAVKDYNSILDQVGRRHIQILGVGDNGHIAFNEPGLSLPLRTSIVDLTAETIEANARFFDKKEDVPTSAITMGIQDILQADTLLFMANGKKKQDVVKRLLETTDLDPRFPASCVLLHKDLILLVDEEAYGKVE